MGRCRAFFNSITRRKVYQFHSDDSAQHVSKLSQVLSTFDLVHLGIGSILGAGIYVVTGEVVWVKTGPAVVVSFLIAAFASYLAGLCYAEFGSRVPKTTGSAYAYSYYTIGELFAFVIGWNLILEYIIGTAADARALSGAIDYLTGNRITAWTKSSFARIPYFGHDFDFLASFLSCLITLILVIGVKESARCTIIFNFLNIAVALFIIGAGATKAHPEYWSAENFAPTGFGGIVSGAATCFYAFVGFDIVATTGEEALSPARSIPIAISATMVVCLVLYISVGSVLSLMMPFRSKAIVESNSYITTAFDLTPGIRWVKWIVGVGAVCGLTSSLMGSQFPLPRIVYAMAKDGLLFEFFTNVSKRTETPILATLIPGLIASLFAGLFDLSSLVEIMSSGTLLAYSLVCTSVLMLHYQKPLELIEPRNKKDLPPSKHAGLKAEQDANGSVASSGNGLSRFLVRSLRKDKVEYHLLDDVSSSVGLDEEQEEDVVLDMTTGDENKLVEEILASSLHRPTNHLVNSCIFFLWVGSFLLGLLFVMHEGSWKNFGLFDKIVLALLLLALVALVVVISYQRKDETTLASLHFYVPLVPITPCLAIFIHSFLMVQLSRYTWIRFIIWNAFGMMIYFGYGIFRARIQVSGRVND